MAAREAAIAIELHKMIRTLTYLLLCLLPIVTVANPKNSEFKFGPRPPDSIYDPSGILTPKQRREIAQPLESILEKEGIEVLLVILPEIGDTPPEHIAKGFLAEWSTRKLNAIALHVPGRPDSPWIVPGAFIDSVVKASMLRGSVDVSQKRVQAEPDDFSKARAAATEASDIMRYWTGGAILRAEGMVKARVDSQLAYEKRQRLIKIAGFVALVGAVPVVLGLLFFISKLRKRAVRVFPLVRKVTRLGAPYSGGSPTNFQ